MSWAGVRVALSLLSALVLSNAGGARRARAQAALPTAARVLVTGCSARINERALQDQLRIELMAAGVQRVRTVEVFADGMVLEDEPNSLATLRVAFPDCEEENDELRLGVADRKTGRHAERALVISDLSDDMRARAIALALTELLRAEWQDLSETSAPPAAQAKDIEAPPQLVKLVASQIVRANEEQRAREAEIAGRLRLEWILSGQLYQKTASGDVGMTLAISKRWSLARLQFGGRFTGGAGAGTDARLFQAANRLLLALCSRGNTPAIEVGAMLEAGWASFNGEDDGKATGAIVTTSGHATLRVPSVGHGETLITVQAGYVVLPMTGRAETSGQLVGYAGPVIGLGVGIASWL